MKSGAEEAHELLEQLCNVFGKEAVGEGLRAVVRRDNGQVVVLCGEIAYSRTEGGQIVAARETSGYPEFAIVGDTPDLRWATSAPGSPELN